jgi:hypothetical protein
MGASADEIDRQINETRDHIDQNLGVLEQRAASNAMRYGRLAAAALGVLAVAGAGVLIYRRFNRLSRREKLQSMLIEALKDLPDTLRDLPDEVTSRLKKPLPSFKLVVNTEDVAREPGTLESIARKVVPAVFSTASGALIDRLTREPEPLGEKGSRAAVPASD